MRKLTETADRNPWWKRLLTGAAFGGVMGALEIWFYEFSLVRLLAAILGGAVFFAILALLSTRFEWRGLRAACVGALAGCVGGAVWWGVARPTSSLVIAMGIGLAGGVLFMMTGQQSQT